MTAMLVFQWFLEFTWALKVYYLLWEDDYYLIIGSTSLSTRGLKVTVWFSEIKAFREDGIKIMDKVDTKSGEKP